MGVVWKEGGEWTTEVCSLDSLGQGLDWGHGRYSGGPLGSPEPQGG